MSIPSQGADAPVTSILIQKPTATPGPKEAALREQRGAEAAVTSGSRRVILLTAASSAPEKPADASSAPTGDKAPGDDKLAIPPFLDRVQGRSKEEAERDRLQARAAKLRPTRFSKASGKSKTGGVSVPSDVNLTEKDKQVIKQMKADAKKQAKLSEKAARKLAKEPAKKSGSKTDLIAEMLKRSGGCTGAEVLMATGWPTVSMPAQAKAAGLKLRKEKVAGSPTRYFGS